jgi:hypothetical protein
MTLRSLLAVLALGACVQAADPPVAAALPGKKANKTSTIRFATSSPKLTQELEVTGLGKKTVSFKLNLSGSCQRTFSGVARLKGGDLESDEDEKGVGYFADEYVHTAKNGCALYLRIKVKDAQRAVVKQADCDPSCVPVEDLMFRKDTPAAK